METNEYDEVIVDNVEDTNEETTEEVVEESRTEKPKRTPQEEYEYHMGRAKRAAKKAGIEVSESKPEKTESPSETNSSKPSDLDYGQIALLNSMVGLKGKDEIALAREYVSHGRDILNLAEDKFFLQDLQNIRDARESANAIPKGRNRSGQTVANDTDLAIATFKETGKLPTDFKSRLAVVKAIEAEEQSSGMFDGTFS